MTIFRTGHLGLLLELHWFWLLVSPVSPLLSMRGHNQLFYYSFRGLGKRDVISGLAVGGCYLLLVTGCTVLVAIGYGLSNAK
jgi:hypothetical protein